MKRINIDNIQVRVNVFSLPPHAVATGRLLRRVSGMGFVEGTEVIWAFRSQPLFRLYGSLTSTVWDDCVFDAMSISAKPEHVAVLVSCAELEHRFFTVKIGDLPPDAYVKGRAMDHREYGKPREAMLFSGDLCRVVPELSRVVFDSIELEELRI